MRKSVLVGVIGVVLLVVGVWAATWIGPDDWVDGPAAVINGGGEVAVATNYGLLSRSFPMRVSASTPDADVFVGIAHVIDADDYLAKTTTAQIHWFSPEGVRAEHRDASAATLPTLPVGLDFWRTWACGDGVQSVEGDFHGQPVVAVVTTASGSPAPLSVRLSSRFPGAFAATVGVAGVGFALLLVAGWWQWRRRPPDGGEPKADPAPTSTPAMTTGGLTALMLSVALCASGCTVPQPFPPADLPPRNQVTRDALDGVDLTALAADYDRRNNIAIAAAAAPRYSDVEWADADAELILGNDHVDTAWHKAKNTTDTPAVCRTKLGSAYPVPAVAGYPLSILVPHGMSCVTTAEPVASSVAVFTKDHSYEPWRLAASPAPDSPGLPATGSNAPGPDAATQAAEAAERISQFLHDGKATLAMPVSFTKWRAKAVRPNSWSTDRLTAMVTPHGVRVAGGDTSVVAVVSLLVTDVATAHPGETIYWIHPWDDIYRQKGSHHQLTRQFGLQMLLSIRAGEVSVIGWERGEYRA
jgi:hypothetical protein